MQFGISGKIIEHIKQLTNEFMEWVFMLQMLAVFFFLQFWLMAVTLSCSSHGS